MAEALLVDDTDLLHAVHYRFLFICVKERVFACAWRKQDCARQYRVLKKFLKRQRRAFVTRTADHELLFFNVKKETKQYRSMYEKEAGLCKAMLLKWLKDFS